MMKAVLKTLALSFGGGLALGAGIRLTQGASSCSKTPPETRVDVDSLLKRLKNVESRIIQMETNAPFARPSAPAAPGIAEKKLAAFESKLAAQLADAQQ